MDSISACSITFPRNDNSLNVAALRRSLVRQFLCYSYRFLDDRTPSRHSERFEFHAQLRIVGSSPDSLPLATIQIPHQPHNPHSIPLEKVTVSMAIYQDISYTSLLGSYEIPGGHEKAKELTSTNPESFECSPKIPRALPDRSVFAPELSDERIGSCVVTLWSRGEVDRE